MAPFASGAPTPANVAENSRLTGVTPAKMPLRVHPAGGAPAKPVYWACFSRGKNATSRLCQAKFLRIVLLFRLIYALQPLLMLLKTAVWQESPLLKCLCAFVWQGAPLLNRIKEAVWQGRFGAKNAERGGEERRARGEKRKRLPQKRQPSSVLILQFAADALTISWLR